MDTASVKSNSSAGFKSRVRDTVSSTATSPMSLPTAAYYFVPYDPRGAYPQSPATGRPLTVRHVKRRDRVKTEEKKRINSFSEKRGAGREEENEVQPVTRIDSWRKSNQLTCATNGTGGTGGTGGRQRVTEDERAVMV